MPASAARATWRMVARHESPAGAEHDGVWALQDACMQGMCCMVCTKHACTHGCSAMMCQAEVCQQFLLCMEGNTPC